MFPITVPNKERVRTGNPPRPNIVAIFVLLAPFLIGVVGMILTENPVWIISGVVIGLILMQSPKVAKQW